MEKVIGFIKKVFSGKKEAGPAVAKLLGGLPEEYTVFNGILYNHSEIHHIVFSKAQGLFVVNPAHEKGEVTYKGAHLLINRKPKSDVVKKTLKDTFWLKSTIREQLGMNVHITPLVAFENARVKITQPIIGVTVLESRGLVEAILNAPQRNVLEDGVVMVLRELQGIHTINYRGA
ncbi:MAG TPA: hypothetical protein VF790_00735 [Dissulfurispiraceae bacterium]